MSETETRDPAAEPTPAQWVDGFRGLVRSEQEHWAANILAEHRVALRCWQANHEARLDDLERAAIDLAGDVASAQSLLTDSRVESARLRGVVEAVQECADLIEGDSGVAHNYGCEGEPTCLACIVASLRSALAPVSSSGEAESGEPGCAECGLPGDQCDGGTCCEACTHSPAPVPSGEAESGEAVGTRAGLLAAREALIAQGVPESDLLMPTSGRAPVTSGGQADGERGDRHRLTTDEHATYQALRARGVSHEDAMSDALDGVAVDVAREVGPVSSGGQADGESVPEQPDGITTDSRRMPDPQRAAERILAYVREAGDGLYDVAGAAPLYGRDLESVAKAALAARPVLSREAVLTTLSEHRPLIAGDVPCECGVERQWHTRVGYLGHLADVLAGGEQRG